MDIVGGDDGVRGRADTRRRIPPPPAEKTLRRVRQTDSFTTEKREKERKKKVHWRRLSDDRETKGAWGKRTRERCQPAAEPLLFSPTRSLRRASGRGGSQRHVHSLRHERGRREGDGGREPAAVQKRMARMKLEHDAVHGARERARALCFHARARQRPGHVTTQFPTKRFFIHIWWCSACDEREVRGRPRTP